MHILHLYVCYDYVQRCEDTVSVELRYINYIYYYYYYSTVIDPNLGGGSHSQHKAKPLCVIFSHTF